MKKKVYGLALAFALLFSAAAGLLLTDSAAVIVPIQEIPSIWINSDGSITPETDLINRNGNVYTLTADIEGYVVRIARNNTVFDGAGHNIYIPPPDPSMTYAGGGLYLFCVTNVTVKNLEVSGVSLSTGINLYYSSFCSVIGVSTFRIYLPGLTERTFSWVEVIGDFNTVTESNIALSVKGSNNLFTKNNVHGLSVTFGMGVGASFGSNNRFYLNNFLLTDRTAIYYDNFWDNGSVGNYWGDSYLIKYPNASEIGNTGIGDTPYIIERCVSSLNDPDAKNVDNYPLMYPYDIENDIILMPTPTLFLIVLVAFASVSAVAVGAGLIIYFKKRKY